VTYRFSRYEETILLRYGGNLFNDKALRIDECGTLLKAFAISKLTIIHTRPLPVASFIRLLTSINASVVDLP